jgi:hypothetical protein
MASAEKSTLKIVDPVRSIYLPAAQSANPVKHWYKVSAFPPENIRSASQRTTSNNAGHKKRVLPI